MKPHKPTPLVLCEGKEDRLVLEMLAKHAGLEGKLAFQDYGGERSQPGIRTGRVLADSRHPGRRCEFQQFMDLDQ